MSVLSAVRVMKAVTCLIRSPSSVRTSSAKGRKDASCSSHWYTPTAAWPFTRTGRGFQRQRPERGPNSRKPAMPSRPPHPPGSGGDRPGGAANLEDARDPPAPPNPGGERRHRPGGVLGEHLDHARDVAPGQRVHVRVDDLLQLLVVHRAQ